MKKRGRAPQKRTQKRKREKPQVRPAVVRTFYDTVRKCVVDQNGNVVTPVQEIAPLIQERTTTNVQLVEAGYLERLYACEPSDATTVASLAELGNLTVPELERRRRGASTMAGLPIQCPGKLPPDRRRCSQCPNLCEDDDDLPF